MDEKELCSVIYIVATVFCVNDFPCANNVRSIGCLFVCSLGNSELHVINFKGTFLSKDPIFHV